jgi:hypothetical protein
VLHSCRPVFWFDKKTHSLLTIGCMLWRVDISSAWSSPRSSCFPSPGLAPSSSSPSTTSARGFPKPAQIPQVSVVLAAHQAVSLASLHAPYVFGAAFLATFSDTGDIMDVNQSFTAVLQDCLTRPDGVIWSISSINQGILIEVHEPAFCLDLVVASSWNRPVVIPCTHCRMVFRFEVCFMLGHNSAVKHLCCEQGLDRFDLKQRVDPKNLKALNTNSRDLTKAFTNHVDPMTRMTGRVNPIRVGVVGDHGPGSKHVPTV